MNVWNPLRFKSKAELGAMDCRFIYFNRLDCHTPEDKTTVVPEFPRGDTLDPVHSGLVELAV